jgi:hypothetical protein
MVCRKDSAQGEAGSGEPGFNSSSAKISRMDNDSVFEKNVPPQASNQKKKIKLKKFPIRNVNRDLSSVSFHGD